MNRIASFRYMGLGAIVAVIAGLLTGCASTASLVDTPQVNLRNVEVTELDLNSQTFLLDFDVINPNPFPLPIRSVSYGVELDGYRFASGETQGAFTVPASSDGSFAISVDLNLMRTAPQLMFIVRNGLYRNIPYRLKGRFDIDIPFTNPVSFDTTGVIRLEAAALSAESRH